MARELHLALGFIIAIDDDIDLTEATETVTAGLAYLGNPRFAPEAVVLLKATEVLDAEVIDG